MAEAWEGFYDGAFSLDDYLDELARMVEEQAHG